MIIIHIYFLIESFIFNNILNTITSMREIIRTPPSTGLGKYSKRIIFFAKSKSNEIIKELDETESEEGMSTQDLQMADNLRWHWVWTTANPRKLGKVGFSKCERKGDLNSTGPEILQVFKLD